MKKQILLSLLFVLYILKINAQITFERTYGGDNYDKGFGVHQTNDGGYIVIGLITGLDTLERNTYLFKTDSRGDTIWTKTFLNLIAYANNIELTYDGGYIIVGSTTDSLTGKSDVLLMKVDSIGNIIWQKTHRYQPSQFGAVKPTFDGGYIIAVYCINDSGYVSYIIKTDDKGDTLWTKNFGKEIALFSIVQTNDSGYIAFGDTSSSGWGSAAYFVRMDANGNVLWTRNYHIAVNWVIDGQQTTDGGFIAVGSNIGAVTNDVYVVKTNANGDTLWTKIFSGTRWKWANSVQQIYDDGYIITGSWGNENDSSWNETELFLLKLDNTGNMQWNKLFNRTNWSEEGMYIEQTSDNGFIIVGGSNDAAGGGEKQTSDIYLIKTDSNGNVLTGINELSPTNQPSVQISPNPFSENAVVRITNVSEFANGKLDFKMFDILGREVLQSTIVNQQSTISRKDLPNGIYFYKISNNQQQITNGKLVIQD